MAPNPQEPTALERGIFFAAIVAAASFVLLPFGCAAPGVPVTRQPAAPRAVNDLSAKQFGDSIVLSFTLPKETVQGRTLSKPLAIEIYRSFENAQPANAAQPPLATTVPPQMVDQYRENGGVRFPDILAPAEFAAHAGSDALYVVRMRLGKHDSGSSNLVRVRILPAPQPIADLRALITKTAVKLSWTVPAILPSDAAAPMSIRYSIYRTEALVGGQALSSGKTQNGTPKPVLLGESSMPSYSDASFAFGHAYAYFVRTVATFEAGSVESDDSNILSVTPRDTFAPATPENVAAAVTRDNGSEPPHVDLSWAINSEADLLGYNVYRSDMENHPGVRVNTSPLITPVFRDDSVVPGKQYFYRVTAVDRSGNESPPSAPVAVTVPDANQDKIP
jgi:hypothetical protein